MYEYMTPFDWLEQAVEKGEVKEHELMFLIAECVDPEEIVFRFQSSMELDGYFDEIQDEEEEEEED